MLESTSVCFLSAFAWLVFLNCFSDGQDPKICIGALGGAELCEESPKPQPCGLVEPHCRLWAPRQTWAALLFHFSSLTN